MTPPNRYKIYWRDLNRTIEVSEGKTVLEAAIDADIPLEHACGGYCACTTCHIRVVEGAQNLSAIADDEDDRLAGKSDLADSSRLACQSKVYGNVTVEIP